MKSRLYRPFTARRTALWIAGLMTAVASLRSVESVGAAEPPAEWQGLELRDLQGKSVPASDHWLVLVFLDPECPIANGYLPVMNALAREFGGRGFRFAGVYTDPGFAPAQLQQHARDYQVEFALIDDRAQKLARFVGATYASEAVIVSPAGAVIYRGRIDDRVGVDGAAKPAATHHDLREVLSRLESGERGPFTSVAGFGCSLAAR
jgi:alkyl hydroperoxide reductase subunit AhpC